MYADSWQNQFNGKGINISYTKIQKNILSFKKTEKLSIREGIKAKGKMEDQRGVINKDRKVEKYTVAKCK